MRVADKLPDWVQQGFFQFLGDCKNELEADTSATYYDEKVQNEVVSASERLLTEYEAIRAWQAIDRRMEGQLLEGRMHFIDQFCRAVSIAVSRRCVDYPDKAEWPSPGKVRTDAAKTRRALAYVINQSADLFAIASSRASATSSAMHMRLASMGISQEPLNNASRSALIRVMLVGLMNDVDSWERVHTLLAKPNCPNAARLLLVRDITGLFATYFGTPLREAVAAFGNAAFPDPGDLDAPTVAKLAPLNQSRKT